MVRERRRSGAWERASHSHLSPEASAPVPSPLRFAGQVTRLLSKLQTIEKKSEKEVNGERSQRRGGMTLEPFLSQWMDSSSFLSHFFYNPSIGEEL